MQAGTKNELYNKMQSVHQEESVIHTVSGVYTHEYPKLPIVYSVQDKYWELYDLILNPAPVEHQLNCSAKTATTEEVSPS